MAFNPCATMASSCLLCFFLLTSICIYPAFSSSSSSSKTISYTEHCSSIVPESSPTIRNNNMSTPHLSTSYFTGGDKLFSRKPGNHTYYYYMAKKLRFRVSPEYYETVATGVYKVEGFLYIRSRNMYDDGARGSIRFLLNGFWSEVSRKLCMVGSASWGGINLDAVLKLKFESKNPTLYTGVVSGTLESIVSADDPGYFETIAMFSFPILFDYKYSMVSKELDGMFPSESKNQSIRLEPTKFCYLIGGRHEVFELEYATECREPRHCSPLGGGDHQFLPRFLSMSPIQCSGDETKFRFLATLQITSYAGESTNYGLTLIGEASWDDKNNDLFGVACQILNPANHFGNPVEDCTMRLLLRYPSILTIRNDAKIIGRFWSSKAVNNSGYFRKINVTSYDSLLGFPGLKYEYTELDKVRYSCPVQKPVKKGNTYPDGHSYDMRFDMHIKSSKGQEIAMGYAAPLFVGNKLYQQREVLGAAISPTGVEAISELDNRATNTSPISISYEVSIGPSNSSNLFSIFNQSMNLNNRIQITAEGVYNFETGYLCMVGCRKLVNSSIQYVSRDCEILVKFEFAALNDRGGFTKGTIESKRAKKDPLYFDKLTTKSVAFYAELAVQSIWRMDLEIAMVLVSSTHACIFAGLQIFHVKSNPEVPSFISLFMLLLLPLEYMIPLVLNFKAVFFENHYNQTLYLSNDGAVRVITMVAFLLQIRLLQLVWTAKRSDTTEKKAGLVSLSFYTLGAFLTFLCNWTRNTYFHRTVGVHNKYSFWGDLRSYAGLILDGFLLPQILLNAFSGSSEKALSESFYIGTSAVRLFPHAYNQYRAHNYPEIESDMTYYYANPAEDFYSTAWDIIIPCGVIAFAVIVFFQQRLGGRFILPKRFRGSEMYEKVPVVDNE